MIIQRNRIIVVTLLLLAALSFRVAVARFLANDDPYDGKVYAQLALNVLEKHVYSHATSPPFEPSIIRLPGYPLFLAGVYRLFGPHNNAAVRLIQAIIDTATCALVALLAFFWEPQAGRKRLASLVGLALAAICPFTTIYVATILTETPTSFLAVAMCLTATLAMQSANARKTLWLWTITGVVAGLAVLFRPDSGLFAAVIGLTLLASHLFGWNKESGNSGSRQGFFQTVGRAAVFSLAFAMVLLPWTIRNKRVFGLFQPLAPAHAEMPGEFVPRGYLMWLRTWIDDERYIAPVLWSLDEVPINVEDLPAKAFDSREEKSRVAALFDRYNHPVGSGEPDAEAEPAESDDSADEESDLPNSASDDQESDTAEETDKGAVTEAPEAQSVSMTPQIDAGFAELARERISNHPFRYYVKLPLMRAAGLWFDTHSQYYPFEGQLFPINDLDHNTKQHLWLPIFVGMLWVYTVLSIAGVWFLWFAKNPSARRWALLAVLICVARLAFFSTLENPEPRYVVELFPFAAALGGIALPRLLQVRDSESSHDSESK